MQKNCLHPMVKDIEDWKMSSRTRDEKTKDTKSYVIPTVEQKPDNIILHTGTNDLKTIVTPEEITMGILNLAMTCKTDTNSFFYIWHCPNILQA